MTEETGTQEQRAFDKRLWRSSRESYSDDDSETNRTPVASVQDEEEVLYEIDPRALEKLPERLQRNYCELFQERLRRLSLKNPNFKYRQYDYMEYWPEEAFRPEAEEQPGYGGKRQYPTKRKVLRELQEPTPQPEYAPERGPLRIMNPDFPQASGMRGGDRDGGNDSEDHRMAGGINVRLGGQNMGDNLATFPISTRHNDHPNLSRMAEVRRPVHGPWTGHGNLVAQAASPTMVPDIRHTESNIQRRQYFRSPGGFWCRRRDVKKWGSM
ncbi:hypothetical protein FQN50_001116 [Emmonsiellopsis sp. PD_5]|nr:hypothetical protein FQN50_001116 [Emmonsiellopsis sp. PD_5]